MRFDWTIGLDDLVTLLVLLGAIYRWVLGLERRMMRLELSLEQVMLKLGMRPRPHSQ